MANWNNAVITDQGKQLINKIMSGETVNITKVKAGSGSVPLIDLRSQTSLVSEKQTLSVVDISSDDTTTSVKVILTSESLTESYKLQQIGFYANDPDNGEILYAISQDSEGNTIPSKDETPMYSITFQFYFTFENDKSMSVVVDNDSFVTNKMLQEESKKRTDADNKLSDTIIELQSQVEENTSSIGNEITRSKNAENELNSNLDSLGYGENGVYNLLDLSKLLNSNFDIEEGNITNKTTDKRAYFNFQAQLYDKYGKIINVALDTSIQSNESKDFTISLNSGCKKIRLKHNGSSDDIIIGTINIVDIGLKENDTITVHISVSSSNPTVVGGIVIKELAIVKGDTFIGYKPYIPSVKMLADEVSVQNDSLEDYGLDNKCVEIVQGSIGSTGSDTEDKNRVKTKDYLYVPNGSIVTVKTSMLISYTVWNESKTSVIYSSEWLSSDIAYEATQNCYVRIKFKKSDDSNFTPSQVGHVGVYINNAIDKLENDLSTVQSQVEENTANIESEITRATNVETELNSKISDLELSDVAGGKNIINIQNPISITATWYKSFRFKCEKNTTYILSLTVDSYTVGSNAAIFTKSQTQLGSFLNKNKITFNSGDNEELYLYLYAGNGTSGTTVYSNVQIEKGTQATSYEPYIPSVKMLAEDVSAQNDSLEDYGMDNKSFVSERGAYNSSYGSKIDHETSYRCADYISCVAGDIIRLVCDGKVGIRVFFYDSSKTMLSTSLVDDITERTVTAPTNAVYYTFHWNNGLTGTPKGFRVYQNNSIDGLKNDLAAYAEGTKAVALAERAIKDGKGNVISDTYAIKDDFNDCGLNNVFDGEWVQGYLGDIVLDGSGTSGIVYISTSKESCLSKNFINCKKGDEVEIICEGVETAIQIYEFNTASVSEVSLSGITKYNRDKISYTVQKEDTKYILFCIRDKIPSNIGKVKVYINNKLHILCNQVGNLSLSVSGTTLTITDGTNTWNLTAN